MSPELLELLAPLFALAGLGGAILIGMKMRYTHLQRSRVSGSTQQDVERLADAVDSLRDEVRLMHDEFVELNERVEFTERLLERPKATGADSEALPGRQN